MRATLRPLEVDAQRQPWDTQRPWRVKTHVMWEGQVPLVDLHDLKAGLARKVVSSVLEQGPAAGAVVFVTGRGRHTVGHEPVLKKVTEGLLREACRADPQARYRTLGPGRMVWIHDPSRAPPAVTGGGWGLTIGWLLFLVAAAVGLLGRC